MDWNAVIERNREALKRVLASLLVMAAVAGGGSTLPRHLHRAVLRLLRPAEAAVRRLVIVAALAATPQARKTGDIVLPAPAPPRPRKPDLKAAHTVLRSLGIAVVMSPDDLARAAAEKRAVEKRAAARAGATRRVTLPLLDPLRLPGPNRPRTVPAHAAPRILSFGGNQPRRLPPPPSPFDPIDATRLAMRLAALASALDDLPAHARRFARWRYRVAVGAQNKESPRNGHMRRVSPLRPGRPPGGRPANPRRPAHEIHEVLADLQWLAFKALERPDTS